MKRNFTRIVMLTVVAALSFGFASCSKGEDEPGGGGGKSIDPKIEALSSELFNTSWTYQYTEFYNNNNGSYSHSNYEFQNAFTYTFSDDIYGNNLYQLVVNGYSDVNCYWCIDENGLDYSATQFGFDILGMSSSEVAAWGACGGATFDTNIYTHTASKLVLRNYYDDGIKYVQHVFKAASNPGGGDNSGGGTGGGSSSYEEPEVGFYDYTSTKSSLKVQYKIYNKDEAEVSSAKIYYGTSTNPSSYKTATVNGVIISANITGLKSGTSYYVKCVATGKGGQTTTTVTRCMTDY